MADHRELVTARFAPKITGASDNAIVRLRETLQANGKLSDFLTEAARDHECVLIIVNDSHRATLSREALVVIGEMIKRDRLNVPCEILVACGTHEFELAERRTFEESLLHGTELAIERIEWHQARATKQLQPIGPYYFNSLLFNRRFLLPIGSVEPHYFAGVTGPHKTVTIGCMSFEDIRANHQGALDPTSEILRLDGNPIHDGVVAALKALQGAQKKICSIGEVASGPALIDVRIGDPVAVVHELLPAALETFVHSIDEPFDLLHLEVPLPLGRSLYQADKALKNNHRAVRDGGGIILEAACPEGVGASAFMKLLRAAPTLQSAKEIISRDGYALGDHKAVKLRELTDPAGRAVKVALISEVIKTDNARAAGITLCHTLEEARQWLETKLSVPVRREAVISDAGFVTVAPVSR